MYESFYSLNADPFRLSADHRFCFNHPSYIRAKGSVQYALYRAEGFVMITGRPGTGKTTLVDDLLASLPPKKYAVGHLVSSQLEGGDLLRMAAYAFGLDAHEQQKAHVLIRLMSFFAERHQEGLRSVLIIDEAQGLAPSALQELRRLSDLQHENDPLLQVVLLGHEGLRTLVRKPEMEPIHQRLVAAWHLDPLGPEETIEYVRHRLERAGWKGDPGFAPGVLPVVYQFSEGIPRRINLICSRLLLAGFLGESHTITVEDAQAVMQELRDAELAQPQDAGSDQSWPPPDECIDADAESAASRDPRTARRTKHEPRTAGGSV
jgi:general secretion pathway protein A